MCPGNNLLMIWNEDITFLITRFCVFNRKLSGSKVWRLLPRLLHRHPAGWHQQGGQGPPNRRQGPGSRRRRKPDLHRLHHVYRPRLGHQEALLRHRNRLGPEDHTHRRAPPLRRPQLHGWGADVGDLRQPGPARTEGVRVRRRAQPARARDRKTDLHAGAGGLLCAGDRAGDRRGGPGPCVLLRSDRRPRPGALGPGTCQARPLGVLVAFQLPESSERTERRSALVLQDPLSTRNMALGQPLDPSTWDVSILKLKPQLQGQSETLKKKCRTHKLFSRLKNNNNNNNTKKKQQQQQKTNKRTNKQDKGPSGVGIFISVTFPCVPFQRMNGALKSFSLNNLFSCELSCLSHKWILTLCERRIVHNLFLYISNAKKKKKKDWKKKRRRKKREKERIWQSERRTM